MMVMTNYMDLLAMHQPWNLILFMVLPVVLAESLVATEFYVTYYRKEGAGNWKKWNHRLGIAAGGYFLLVFLYLMTNVVPGLSWKGWTDELAIWAYLLGIVPLGAIALMELGIIDKHATEHQRTMRHFGLLIGFLVVSHVAMVFGMVDPTLSGWRPAGAPMQKGMDHSAMPGMQQSAVPQKGNRVLAAAYSAQGKTAYAAQNLDNSGANNNNGNWQGGPCWGYNQNGRGNANPGNGQNWTPPCWGGNGNANQDNRSVTASGYNF